MPLSELSLEEIELFVAFARYDRASKAAQVMSLSQPAFNERIRRLEARLVPSPFAWRGNKRVLSGFGRKLLTEVEPHLRTLRSCVNGLFSSELVLSSRALRIAGRNEILSRLAMAKAWYPHPIELRVCSSREALDRVEDGRCDVALSVVRPERAHLVQKRLFFSTATLVLSRSLLPRGWRARGWPSLEEGRQLLLRIPWMAYGDEDLLHRAYLKAMDIPVEGIQRQVMCDDWQILWRLARSGVGAAVLPAAYVEPHADDLFFHSPSRDFQRNPFYVVTRRDLVRLEPVQKFVEFAKAALGDET